MDRHLTAFALTFTIGAVVGIGTLAFQRVDDLVAHANFAVHGRGVIAAAERVDAVMREAESAHRGFLLSGHPDERSAYDEAQNKLEAGLRELQDLSQSHPERQAEIAQLVDAVRQSRVLTDASVASREDEPAVPTSAAEHTRVREASQRAHGAAAALITAEQRGLAEREAAATTTARATRWLIVAAFALAAGASLFAAMQIRRELWRRQRAEGAAISLSRDMEARVRSRTHELSALNERLTQSEEQFRVIAEVSPVHLFATAPDGSATYISPGFSTMTGLNGAQTLGFGWTEAIHPEDRPLVLTGWQEAVGTGDFFQSDFRFAQATGGYRWFKARVVPVRNEQGTIVRWVGAVADIHEQQESLEARAAALEREQHARSEAERASKLKDDFLSTVSHELRTPLNAIVGWVHVMRTGILSPDETHRALLAIDRNAQAQTRVVDDLLDVSRMVQGRMTLSMASCALGPLVQHVVQSLEPTAKSKGLTLSLVDEATGVVVNGDEARLKQIVWNLVSNAIKFTGREGQVTIAVGRAGEMAFIRVTDTGEGIDSSFLPHVFDPFRQGASQTMRVGLGLGLAIVHELVALHGGEVDAESAGLGRGAAFTVRLPLYTAQPDAMPPREAPLTGLRVLIAEDDADSAEALSTILGQHGCDVRAVSSVKECMSTVVQWRPHVLVCDVGLPDADGYALLRRVRALPGLRDIPAIALTARAADEDRTRALAAGYRAHVPKPLDPATLLREIGRASAYQSAS